MPEEFEDEELEDEFGMPILTEEVEEDSGFEEGEGAKSLAEAEEEAPHQTDLQSVLKYLHPKFRDKRHNDLLQPIMASRIFPDNYLDLNYLLVMSMIEEHEGDDDIDVVAIITNSQVATSIGYEGRGRIEDLEVAGVAHEEELERLSKDLGLT